MEADEEVDNAFPKANNLNRAIAKSIDLLIAMALSQILQPVGFYAGVLYLLIADGFAGGQSLGKYLLGITVLSRELSEINPFRLSILRNLPIVFGFVLFCVPYVGWFFFA
ncbi:MAG TPA: hypothetical protein VGB26_12595 [Nitrospiria bacterium]|jgi:uncharacterized RDD family membrane protein YckC